MKKQKFLQITNMILFILILWIAGTAISHDFINKEIFEKIHPIGGFLLLITLIMHLVLNWGWIKANYFKKQG